MRLKNGFLSRQAFILRRKFLIDPSRYLETSLTRATTILTSAEALSCRAFCLLHINAAADLNSPAAVLLLLRISSLGHNEGS
jgi:hypothetical protein